MFPPLRAILFAKVSIKKCYNDFFVWYIFSISIFENGKNDDYHSHNISFHFFFQETLAVSDCRSLLRDCKSPEEHYTWECLKISECCLENDARKAFIEKNDQTNGNDQPIKPNHSYDNSGTNPTVNPGRNNYQTDVVHSIKTNDHYDKSGTNNQLKQGANISHESNNSYMVYRVNNLITSKQK